MEMFGTQVDGASRKKKPPDVDRESAPLRVPHEQMLPLDSVVVVDDGFPERWTLEQVKPFQPLPCTSDRESEKARERSKVVILYLLPLASSQRPTASLSLYSCLVSNGLRMAMTTHHRHRPPAPCPLIWPG